MLTPEENREENKNLEAGDENLIIDIDFGKIRKILEADTVRIVRNDKISKKTKEKKLSVEMIGSPLYAASKIGNPKPSP